MATALVLIAAVLLGLLGGWGLYRLLGRLDLTGPERFALTLALLPAILGLAAFAGLLVGWPGPAVPGAVCLVLAMGGALTSSPEAPLTPRPPLPTVGEGASDSLAPLSRAQGEGLGVRAPGGWGVRALPRPDVLAVLLYGAGALGTTLLTPLSGGALRIGDWIAHWFLVLVYLGQPLPDLRTFTNRVGDFGVISRPPLYNLEGGLLVGALAGLAEPRFWPFQLLTPVLALAIVATAVLWARAIGGAGAAWVVAALTGLSPFLLQNASYPWSKMVAAGLVLLFLWLIRASALAWRPARARQTFVLAAFCAGLGYLAHQTTIFYVLPTLLWLVWRRPRALFGRSASWVLGTWALGGLAGLLAFAPWQGWVLATYGLRETLEANPAWFGADVSETFGDWLLKGGVATIGTLIPLPALEALARGSWPTLDQLLRVQLALLTGALGISGCWLLIRAAWGSPLPPTPSPLRGRGGARCTSSSSSTQGGRRRGVVALRPPWLALVVLCGFLGQVMLQPNWHDTGDAAESMTPIVVLALAYVAREALRLGPTARRVFVGLVLAEVLIYLGLWLWWAFTPAWTRDPNAVLASRYGLAHVRGLWGPAVPVGALLLAGGLSGSVLLLWRTLVSGRPESPRPARAHADVQDRPGQPVTPG